MGGVGGSGRPSEKHQSTLRATWPQESDDAIRLNAGKACVALAFIGRFLTLLTARAGGAATQPGDDAHIQHSDTKVGAGLSAGVPTLRWTGWEETPDEDWKPQEFGLVVRFWTGAGAQQSDRPSGSLPTGADEGGVE